MNKGIDQLGGLEEEVQGTRRSVATGGDEPGKVEDWIQLRQEPNFFPYSTQPLEGKHLQLRTRRTHLPHLINKTQEIPGRVEAIGATLGPNVSGMKERE